MQINFQKQKLKIHAGHHHHEKSYSEEGNLVIHKIVSIGVCRNLLRTIVTIANQNMGLKIKNSTTLYSGS